MANDLAWRTETDVPLPDVSTAANYYASILHCLLAMLRGVLVGNPGVGGAIPASYRHGLKGSSDGVTAAMDGVDRLQPGGVFNAAKWVNANNGAITAHSWAALTAPGGGFELLIDRSGSASLFLFTFMLGGPAHPFVAAATPTWTPSGGSMGKTTLPFADAVADAATYKAHITMAPDGQFHFAISRSTFGVITVISAVKIKNPRPGDDYPWVIWSTYLDTGSGPFGITDSAFWSTASSSSPVTSSRNGRNLAPGASNRCIPYGIGSGVDGPLGNGSNTVNYTNKNTTDGLWDSEPLKFLFTDTGNLGGVKGQAYDMLHVPLIGTPLSPGRIPTTGDLEKIQLGMVALPFTRMPAF